MVRFSLSLAVLGTVWLSSCATYSAIRTPFDPKTHAQYEQLGTAAIVGELDPTWLSPEFLGQPVLATKAGFAGREVWCLPRTPYTVEWYSQTVMNGCFPSAVETWSGAGLYPGETRPGWVRAAAADEHGGFRFEHLPPGEYFVCAWAGPGSPREAARRINDGATALRLGDYSAWVGGRVRVADGETAKVVCRSGFSGPTMGSSGGIGGALAFSLVSSGDCGRSSLSRPHR